MTNIIITSESHEMEQTMKEIRQKMDQKRNEMVEEMNRTKQKMRQGDKNSTLNNI